LPKEGERAERVGINADISHRIVELAGAARIVVGSLHIERHPSIAGDRVRTVAELQRVRIEAGFELADESPAGRKGLIDQYAYRRRAQSSRRERPHRLSVHFLNQVGAALREMRIERRSVSLVATASVDRAVEPDAIPAQRAVRDKESPDTPVQALDVVDNAAAGALVTMGSSAKACPAVASSPAAKVTTRGSISLSNIFYSPRVLKRQGRNWIFS